MPSPKNLEVDPQRIGVSKNGKITAQHPKATQVGSKILQQGGNAIDAAVATAFAFGVCEPNAFSLNGQLFDDFFTGA